MFVHFFKLLPCANLKKIARTKKHVAPKFALTCGSKLENLWIGGKLLRLLMANACRRNGKIKFELNGSFGLLRTESQAPL